MLITLVALALAGTAVPPLSSAPLSADDLRYEPDANGQPNDVGQWLLRYDACLHWSGEPGEDPVRRRQIARGMAESCTGLRAQRQRLLVKYARLSKTVALLRARADMD